MSGTYRYSNPRQISWGAGSIAGLAGELERLGVYRAGIVTTRSVAGGHQLREVRRVLGGVVEVALVLIGQHAPLADIDAARRVLVAAKPDGLLSVGGGSPVDAAKILALDVAAETGRDRLPHLAVPTTLSVAELGDGAGFTDAQGGKAGRRDGGLLPDAVIYDGALAVHTPLELWLSTGVRALDHAVEGFLAPGEHPLPDVLAAESVRRLLASLPRARTSPLDAAVRTENQLAAWFGFTLPGPAAAGLSHMLGKQIGARHGIPHGVTSCLLLPHVLRYRALTEEARIRALAAASGLGDSVEAIAGAIERLVAGLGLPGHLGAYGLTDADVEAAATAQAGRHPATALAGIYRAAW